MKYILKNIISISRLRLLIVIFCFLILFLIINLNFTISQNAQDDLLDNLPPVSNPKLDEKKHNLLNSVEVLEEVFFVGDDSYDPDPGDNLSYHWDFGDGDNSVEISPIHVYMKVGEYVVSLTVNDTNSSDTSNFKIRVISQGNHKPIPILKTMAQRDEFGNYYADTHEPIFFNGTDSFDPDGFTLTYDWYFGDGDTGIGENVIHEFSDDGTYLITLTITDNEFLEAKTSIEIVVGTGEGKNEDENENDTESGAQSLGYMIVGFIVVIIIILLVLWLYLSQAKKHAMKQVKLTSMEFAENIPTTSRSIGPPIPEFSKPRTQKRDSLVRQARIERLTTHQKDVKKDVLRQRLASERKKVDDDMKKELEDMGIKF